MAEFGYINMSSYSWEIIDKWYEKKSFTYSNKCLNEKWKRRNIIIYGLSQMNLSLKFGNQAAIKWLINSQRHGTKTKGSNVSYQKIYGKMINHIA